MLSTFMKYVCSNLDPLQFAYLTKRTTEDAINTFLHNTTQHPEEKTPTYVRSFFIDYSLAFNTMQSHLPIKNLTIMMLVPASNSGYKNSSPTEPNNVKNI